MPNKRGIVISPPFESEQPSNTIVSPGGNPSPADLRKYLLYWDEIDYPDSNLTPISPNQDIQFLIDEKIVTRTSFNFSNITPPVGYDYVVFGPDARHELMCIAQKSAFDKHDKENPGLWSLAQLSTKLVFLPKSEPTVGVEYELYNMLPVPTADVHLNDILEFKQKHYDELVELRCYLDEVYQKIISSADIPRAKNTELTKLGTSLEKIYTALSYSRIKTTVTSLRGYIAGEIIPAAEITIGVSNLISEGVAPFITMSPLQAGITCAGIVFAFKAVAFPKARTNSHPLIYISSMKKDELTWWEK